MGRAQALRQGAGVCSFLLPVRRALDVTGCMDRGRAEVQGMHAGEVAVGDVGRVYGRCAERGQILIRRCRVYLKLVHSFQYITLVFCIEHCLFLTATASAKTTRVLGLACLASRIFLQCLDFSVQLPVDCTLRAHGLGFRLHRSIALSACRMFAAALACFVKVLRGKHAQNVAAKFPVRGTRVQQNSRGRLLKLVVFSRPKYSSASHEIMRGMLGDIML